MLDTATPARRSRARIFGREQQQLRLQRGLTSAREGSADRVMVVGAPGTGRTALLDQLAASAEGATVLRASAVAAEAQLAYATLYDLCRPVLPLVDELPAAQGDLLAGALSLRPSPPTSPMAVGAALLSLLVEASRRSPVLLLVDDLDAADAESIDALSFAVRRLDAEAVAVVVALGPAPIPRFGASSFDVVTLEPLGRADATAVLEEVAPIVPDPRVRDALLDVAQGNPLALTLLARSLSLAQLRGRWPLPTPLPSPDRLAEMVAWELEGLSPEASWGLVVVAASLTGSRRSIESALAGMGVPTGGIGELLARGLVVEDDGVVRFARPILRSVVYAGAAAADRRRAHSSLAEVIGGEHALEHRAWHRAAAAVGPDAEASALLEQAAAGWRDRGAPASAAAALDRAVALTPAPADRARRRVLTADALLALGETERAEVHLAIVAAETTAPDVVAAALHLRGRILVNQGSGSAGQALLTDGARMARRHDPERAALMLCEAALAAVNGRRYDEGFELSRLAAEIGDLTESSRRLTGLVRGTALIAAGETEDGLAILGSHIGDLEGEQSTGRAAPVLDATALALVWAERYAEARQLLDRLVEDRRRAFALGMLVPALATRALLSARSGTAVHAFADAVEALRLMEGDDSHALRAAALATLASVEAALGAEPACLGHVEACLAILGESRKGATLRQAAMSAAAALELSCGRPARAVEWLSRLQASGAGARQGSPAIVMWQADLAEALALEHRPDEAAAVLDGFEARAMAADNRRALGAAARGRALLASGDEAEAWFRRSLEWYADPVHPVGAARTELAWGERLLADGNGDEARPHLERALDAFADLWAAAWAERAAAALESAGGTPCRRLVPLRRLSTAAAEVVLLTAAGLPPGGVASRLALSEQTVRHLLEEATATLGDLPPALPDTAATRVPAARPFPSAPPTTAASTTSVQVLGGFRVLRGEEDVTPPPGLGAKLVKLLAVSNAGRGLAVEEVIDVLWPDASADAGRIRLRNVLSRLRQTSGDVVVRDGETLRLRPDAEVDLQRFEDLAKSALVAHGSADADADADVVALARAALVLHGGTLLPDSPYEGWAAGPRERARRQLLELLDLMSEHHRSAGRHDNAVLLLERAIEIDPYDEERYVVAAEVRRQQGRHGAALALVSRARAVVAEMGLSPSPRLLAVERSLRH